MNMLVNLKILWIFYRKLLIPGVIFSLLISIPTEIDFKNFSFGFLFIFPLMHYFIYELRLKNEYLFYANFGFSRISLWSLTVSFSIILQLISAIL
ncbi:hypothetical protein LPB90_04405 [Chryseobacterium sp. LC2016-29]|uniref:hypothetical protein n=1 Tax=Chryseobacterium sp. LC2016-29 TaxID=2897331 RepID=UPI001E5A67AF|nr:hypothetical protein [Chryseobacterium sp. LC2016-29]MCD0477682.1 hypothetical protein [Chryseobacterium sp. LC2016-29]